MLNEIISGKSRKVAYAVYAFLGVVVGSVQVAYLAAETGQPVWLTVTLAIYAYVGTAFGATAGGNVHDAPEHA